MTNQITVVYSYTDDDLENILVTALEGVTGYWACLDNTRPEFANQPDDMPTAVWCWKILCDCGSLHFLEEEGDEEWDMDMADFYKGISRAIKNGEWDSDVDNVDALVADAIMQYAMLGSIVYG